jgi:hypothetical protein
MSYGHTCDAGSSGSSGKGLRERPRPEDGGRKEREYYGPQNWAVKGGVNDLSDEYIEVSPRGHGMHGNIRLTMIDLTSSSSSRRRKNSVIL